MPSVTVWNNWIGGGAQGGHEEAWEPILGARGARVMSCVVVETRVGLATTTRHCEVVPHYVVPRVRIPFVSATF
jgi:hypothetical protein